MPTIPSMPEVSFVAQSRGALSCAPHLWRGVVNLGTAWAGVQGGYIFDWAKVHGTRGTISEQPATDGGVTPRWTTSRYGSALLWLEVSLYNAVLSWPSYATGPDTVCCWMRPSFAHDTEQSYYAFRSGDQRVQWGYSPRRLELTVRTSDGSFPVSYEMTSDDALMRNEWQLLTTVIADGTGTLYRNGIELASVSYTGTLSDPSNVLAVSNSWGPGWYEGDFGAITRWNRALAPAEIRQLYIDPHCMTRLDRSRLGVFRAAAAQDFPFRLYYMGVAG